MNETDYTDPATIDVDVVIGNIRHAHAMRGNRWTDERSWPNVTVLALANEIVDLKGRLAEIVEIANPFRLEGQACD